MALFNGTSGTSTATPPPPAWPDITEKPLTFPPTLHEHDDRYYPQSTLDTALAGKAATGHAHALTSSAITGVLPVNKGGVPASPATGQVLGEFGGVPAWISGGGGASQKTVKDYGAVGDGVADDTAALQAAIDAERVVVLAPCQGGYLVTSELVVPSRRTIFGYGFASRIVKKDPRSEQRIFVNSDFTNGNEYITFDGVYIEGDWNGKTPKEWAPSKSYSVGQMVKPVGTEPTNAQGRRIYEVTVAGTSGTTEPNWPTSPGATVTSGSVTFKEYGTAVEQFCVLMNISSPTTNTAMNKHINFRNCTIRDWFGVSYRLHGMQDSSTVNCVADHNIRGGIVYSYHGARIVIVGNRCTQLGDDCIAVNASTDAKAYDDVTISGNLCDSRNDADYGAGVVTRAVKGGVIGNNTIQRPKNAGILVADYTGTNTVDMTVTGNTIRAGKTDGIEVQADNAQGILIQGNDIFGMLRDGIRIEGVAGSTASISLRNFLIQSNRVRASGSSTYPDARGIHIYGRVASDQLIQLALKDNQIDGAGAEGIRAGSSMKLPEAHVSDNQVRNVADRTSGVSALLVSDPSRFIVSDNSIADTRGTKLHGRGVFVWAGVDGLVADNFALNSDCTVTSGGVTTGGSPTNVAVQGNKT